VAEVDEIQELKNEIKELIDLKKEGFTEIQDEVIQTGKTLKDVQDDVVKLEEKLVEKEDELEEVKGQLAQEGRLPNGDKLDEKEDFGFDSLGEFVAVAMSNSKNNPQDKRLKDVGEYMQKELATDPASAGGFAIPERFGEMIDLFEPQGAIFRPRATVIPAGDPPEAKINFPALNQTGDKGVYAGVEVSWIEEGGTKPETDYEYRDISLEPHEVAAHIPVTDKLLRNAPGVAGTINQLLTWALRQAEDDEFMTGDGVGKPLGVLGHDSTITVTRETAAEVNYADIVDMYAKIVFGGDYVWSANQTVLPQLMQMTDAADNLIWQPNAREGSPGSVLGVPLLMNQRQPTLDSGDGDIGLFDFRYYYIKDGVGPLIASSEHVEFKNNKTLVKAFLSVDGQPAIDDKLELEDGENVSPFVVLAEK